MTIRLNDPAPERKTLALTARDLEDLDRLRSPGPERTALAELSGSALRGEVSEPVLLHAVFTAGLRAVREMTEARAYAEAVFQRQAALAAGGPEQGALPTPDRDPDRGAT